MSDPSPTIDSQRRRWILRASGLGVALATLALMLATEPKLAIVWDEGYTLGRENRIRLWFRALRDPAAFARTWTPPGLELVQVDARMPPPPRPDQIDTRAKLFDRAVLNWFWPFAREEPHGHPPFYALVGLIGDWAVPNWPELERGRFGPMLVFSLTGGCLFGFMARRWGPWAGAAGAGAWVLQPQLFGHGHYAAYDALLTCLWVDAILAFWLAVEEGRTRWAWAAVFGVLLGWAADIKLTGWFLGVPFVGWVTFYGLARALGRSTPHLNPPPQGGREAEAGPPKSSPSPLAGEGRMGGERVKATIRVALLAAPLALVTLYLFNPAWWLDPIGGVERFLRSNTTREKTQPIPVLFLGRIYDSPAESLPWYNTLVWTAMATPVGFLALAIVGSVRAIRRWRTEPFGLLVLGHWAFLIALRALPHTPGHDGVRLFLPAFGVLAILAGLGAASLVERWRRWGRAIVVVALIEGAASVAVMMPVPLSYYSPLVGGLFGASRMGMEATYYWDGLDDETLDFLNTHTPPGYRVQFATFPTSLLYLKKTGRLKAALAPIDPGIDGLVRPPESPRGVPGRRPDLPGEGAGAANVEQAPDAARLGLPHQPAVRPMTTSPEPPHKLPSWAAPALVFALAMAALAPTTGDIGLTWDEPSYRYSQVLSAQWWGRLFRNPTDPSLFTADALLYYWPYGRYGINFHPPLAGQLDLLTYELFGGFMKDIPARRMASVIEFALTVTVLYQFLARRYGAWVGGVAAASLLLMPRVYGDAHIAGTDTPGLLLWAATAVAFWTGLHEPNARWWRVAVGVLVGLAFVEKMGAVMVVLPLLLWLVFGHIPRLFRKGTRADWIDGLVTSTAMLVPLGLAFHEVRRLADVFLQIQRGMGTPEASVSPANTDLFVQHPQSHLPAWILLAPLAVWIVRRLLARIFPKSPLWGAERPALETWTAMLAFGPVVAWLGNPAWWRETLPRLAHYYAINTGAPRGPARHQDSLLRPDL